MASLAEQMVDALQKLRKQDRDLDGWMRDIRLGERLGTEETVTVKRMFMRHSETRTTNLDGSLTHEFYLFLQEKRRGVQAEITRIEKELAELTRPGEPS